MATICMRTAPDADDLVNPTIEWVLIDVEGPKLKCTFMLPTCEREYLGPEHFKGWVEVIQGPELTQCDVNEHQRNTLLHITLAYWGLVGGWPDIDHSCYGPFVDRLTKAALELKPDDDAEKELNKIVQELRGSLPDALFDGPHIPPITEEEDEASFTRVLPETGPYDGWPLFIPNPLPAGAPGSGAEVTFDSDDDLPPMVSGAGFDSDDDMVSGAGFTFDSDDDLPPMVSRAGFDSDDDLPPMVSRAGFDSDDDLPPMVSGAGFTFDSDDDLPPMVDHDGQGAGALD